MFIGISILILLVSGVSSRLDFCSDKSCDTCFKTIQPEGCYIQKGYVIFDGMREDFGFVNESSFQSYPSVYLSSSPACETWDFVIYFEDGPSCYNIDIPLILNTTDVGSIKYSTPGARYKRRT